MFKGLSEEIKILNANIADLASQEKAKALRKQLLIWGGVMTAVGFIGVFVCFALFVINGFSAVNSFEMGFDSKIIIPFLLIIPFAFLGSVGVTVLRLGLSILIGGAVAKFVDESLTNKCECGNEIEENEIFCSKCGKPLKKICPNCKNENSLGDVYCKKCGTKLD